MATEPSSYSTSPGSYASRVKKLLDAGDSASLLYAALELRCGVEARIRQLLDEGSAWFDYACSGDLIGAPLLNRKTKQISLRLSVLDDDPRWPLLRSMAMGDEHLVNVAYEPIPADPKRA